MPSTPFGNRRVSLTLVARMLPRNEGQTNVTDVRGFDYCDRFLGRIENDLPRANLRKRLVFCSIFHSCRSRGGHTPVENRRNKPIT